MTLLLRALSALLCCSLSSSNTLDPAGKNVCQNSRNPSTLVCCPGWRQEGKECAKPVCEGEQACLKGEICVYPGVCRCPPGYFGAQCKTRCPSEFWASDCRKLCPCHPNGQCHPITGECTCNPNRWGEQCKQTCKCNRVGSAGPSCDQLTGRCQCRKGYWGLKCPGTCNCHLSQCNQRTGVCECEPQWWGPSCAQRCNCDLKHSSCDLSTGQCLCHPGFKGPYCNQPCGEEEYGSGCTRRCGFCRNKERCSVINGTCSACEPGWNGTRCDHPCPPGSYGDGCKETCPRCRNNEPCDPKTGKCLRCEPGFTGSRCEEACSNRTFGDACSFLCSPCFHGKCHRVTGRCVCDEGFQGESCNSSCPALQFGINCSSACDCGEGVECHPQTGVCPYSVRGSVLAGVLVPLLLLFVAVLCCCLFCGGGPVDSKDRATVAEGGWSARMKYHVYSVLANIGAALPCISDWSSGLPRVTVSHHDPELTFNHSFIEPPSSGWMTEGSSFDSDEEEGEALYCVPPREDIPAVAGGEFQELSSKCNMFLDPSGFSSEDITSPFNIPRTSSIAKAKRPSVSFAEGTRFSPKERRGSAQDQAALPGHQRNKPKSPWGVLMLSALQSQGGASKNADEEGAEREERDDEVDVQETDNQESSCEVGDQEVDKTPSRSTLQVPGASGRRRTMSNTAAHKGTQLQTSASDAQAGDSGKITTVYVTLGKAGRPVTKTEASSEGPVQAMLRRLGSLQRREQESSKPKLKAAEGVTKPPRKKLGARASVWEQGGPSGGEVGVCKPIRRKHASLNTPDTAGAGDTPSSETGTPKRPLSSILKSVPELGSAESGSDLRADGDVCTGNTESTYLTVGPAGDAVSLKVIANEAAVVSVNDEPCYENVSFKH